MSDKVEFESREAKRLLGDLINQAKHPRDIMRAVGGAAKSRILLGFSKQQAPDGAPWKPQKSRPGGVTGTDSGILKRSFLVKADDRSVEIGTNVCYARVFHSGATIEADPNSKGARSLCGYTVKGSPYLRFMVAGKAVRAKRVVIPARPIIPEGRLPPTWEKAIKRAALRALSKDLDS